MTGHLQMKIFELSIVVTLKGEGLERKVNIFVVLCVSFSYRSQYTNILGMCASYKPQVV